MKKYYSLIATLVFSLFVFASCTKSSMADEINPPTTNSINATIAPNQSYQYAVSDAGELTIVKQARHFKTSELSTDEKTGKLMYQYTPAQDYTGIEEIIVANKKIIPVIQSGGCNNSYHQNNPTEASYNITYTMIRLNISN